MAERIIFSRSAIPPDDHHLAERPPPHFKLSKNVGLLPLIGSLLSITDWPYASHPILSAPKPLFVRRTKMRPIHV
jgi:hypothetical protein